jgi:hypothetical protein
MSFCTQTRDTPYTRATSLLPRPSIVTAVITSRAIDMGHFRAKEGANYVPGQDAVYVVQPVTQGGSQSFALTSGLFGRILEGQHALVGLAWKRGSPRLVRIQFREARSSWSATASRSSAESPA